MQKIDAHQHFRNLQKFPNPRLNPVITDLYRNFEPHDIRPHLIATGIDGTIAVQTIPATAETEWLLELTRPNPFIKGVIGWLNLAAYDLDAQIENLCAKGPLCGLRHQLHHEPDLTWLLQPTILRGLRLTAARNLTYDLLVRPEHLPLHVRQ
jgi:L-fuconolactonase